MLCEVPHQVQHGGDCTHIPDMLLPPSSGCSILFSFLRRSRFAIPATRPPTSSTTLLAMQHGGDCTLPMIGRSVSICRALHMHFQNGDDSAHHHEVSSLRGDYANFKDLPAGSASQMPMLHWQGSAVKLPAQRTILPPPAP